MDAIGEAAKQARKKRRAKHRRQTAALHGQQGKTDEQHPFQQIHEAQEAEVLGLPDQTHMGMSDHANHQPASQQQVIDSRPLHAPSRPPGDKGSIGRDDQHPAQQAKGGGQHGDGTKALQQPFPLAPHDHLRQDRA